MLRIPDDLLYEDNHLLAVNKPAGIATMGAAPGKSSLIQLLKQYIKERYSKPGNVYLGVVSRLDAPVSGVVLFARTSKAADRLTRQFAQHATRKTYWALVESGPKDRESQLVDWLRHDDGLRKVVVTPSGAAGAKEARLHYRVLKAFADSTLLQIQLETGRKHQIRVQLAHHGMPILGDRRYGSDRPFPRGIALHSRFLEFVHPVKAVAVRLEAPIPKYWKSVVGDWRDV